MDNLPTAVVAVVADQAMVMVAQPREAEAMVVTVIRDANMGAGIQVKICCANIEMGYLSSNNLTAVNLLPSNLSDPLCTDWFYVGHECTKEYGMCNEVHCNFDLIRSPANKKLVVDHVTNIDGLWFNKNDVRSITQQAHKANLGGPNGPGTD